MICQSGADSHIQIDFIRLESGQVVFNGVFGVTQGDLAAAFAAVGMSCEEEGTRTVYPLRSDCEVHEHVAGGAKDERILARRFSCAIPLSAARMRIGWTSTGKGTSFSWRKMPHGWFSPLSERVRHAYFSAAGHLVFRDGDSLVVAPRTLFGAVRAEMRLWFELLFKFESAAVKALLFRVLCAVLRPFCRRVWLFTDREGLADDNARALFEYVCAQPRRPGAPKCVFAVAGGRRTFGRAPSGGAVRDIGGLLYKLDFLLSEFVVSSHRKRIQRMPFTASFMAYSKDLVNRPRFVYLRHGVSQNDLADDLGRPLINPRILVSSARREYESILSGRYGYTEREVKLCGLARFDRLYDARERLITIMPTWRGYLVHRLDSSRFELLPGFEESTYCRTLGELCTDARLKAACERHGYALQLLMHPNFAFALDRFRIGPHVRVLPAGVRYRDVFATSSLVVTDYSSVAFDFAYLKKPVVYFQPDFDEFYGRQYVPGYFDYRRDGFGDVETSVAATVDRLIAQMEGDCRMSPEYAARVDAFFGFNDHENCRRIHEAMLTAADEDRGGER